MRFSDRCVDCLLTRVEFESRLATDDPVIVQNAVESCRLRLQEIMGMDVPGPIIASIIHRTACAIVNDADPYRVLKSCNNSDAMRVCMEVKNRLRTFRDMCLAAIIGNTLDYGSKEHKVTNDFTRFFNEEFEKGLTVDDTVRILQKCERVVYLCDNCGEIVFDKLLIKYLKCRGSQVTVVAKAAPILNDATVEDVLNLGLGDVADQILPNTTGIPELGLNIDLLPPELEQALDRCTLIIAKGMANYESLSEYTGLPPVAYLMSVKCEPIAGHLGIPKGSRIAVLKE